MFLVIRKKHLLTLLFCLCGVGVLTALLWRSPGGPAVDSFGIEDVYPDVVVIDPGHGGEDGGAVAADGTVESGLNLEIALRIRDLLRFCGHQTAMTRCEDISIYSTGSETLHQKKVSDLKNRVALVNGTPNAVLLSIHQNMLPASPSVHGAQVFYNQMEGSDALAKTIQQALNTVINPGSEKMEKRISDSIYLMKHVTAPAVLVECGFLSNRSETAQLKDSKYQRRLALAITAGFLNGMTTETTNVPSESNGSSIQE